MLKTKNPITNQFLALKEMYKGGNMDLELFDLLSRDLINTLGELTMHGITEIEGKSLDAWKDRVWNLIENAGLLPEYRDEEDESGFIEITDNWYLED
jgi:hypothetical protein